MNDLLNNTSVIIRSSGERTEGLCRYAIEQNGVPEENIHMIKNVKPFSQALREGYELAIELGKPYTFFVDADSVVKKESLLTIVTAMDRLPENTFSMSVLAYDYLTGTIAPQGPHLYRTKHLKKALLKIPTEQTTKRPETFTKKKMRESGLELVFLDFLTAFHEFEQFYSDIFERVINKTLKSSTFNRIIEYRIKEISRYDQVEAELITTAYHCAIKENTVFTLESGIFDNLFSSTWTQGERSVIQDSKEEYQKNFDRMHQQIHNFTFNGYSRELYTEQVKVRSRSRLRSIAKKVLGRS